MVIVREERSGGMYMGIRVTTSASGPIIGHVYSETSVYVVGDEFVHVFLFFSLLFFLFVKGYFQDDDMIGPRLHYGLWGRLLQGVFSPPVDQSSVNYVFADSFPLQVRPVEGSWLLVNPPPLLL